mgnify:CR=1 FL=1
MSRVHDGAGGMILVAGESGIGKTSFTRAVTKTARAAGVAVAWAGHPSGITLPQHWAWIQVLRQLGNEFGADGRGTVRRAASGVSDALVPEWNSESALAGASVPASGFALAEGIVVALEAFSAIRPVLVVIDDAQDADQPTLDALAHSVDAPQGKGIANVGRLSDAELDALLPTTGYEIVKPPPTYVPIRAAPSKLTATPTPLDQTSSTRLAAARWRRGRPTSERPSNGNCCNVWMPVRRC